MAGTATYENLFNAPAEDAIVATSRAQRAGEDAFDFFGDDGFRVVMRVVIRDRRAPNSRTMMAMVQREVTRR